MPRHCTPVGWQPGAEYVCTGGDTAVGLLPIARPFLAASQGGDVVATPVIGVPIGVAERQHALRATLSPSALALTLEVRF